MWLDYLKLKNDNETAIMCVNAVYNYICGGTLETDLKKSGVKFKETSTICFCVNSESDLENRLWRMPEMWRAWQDYYINEVLKTNVSKFQKNSDKDKGDENKPDRAFYDFCYITGEDVLCVGKQPNSINRMTGKAKLISGNDNTNFTYRGRFKHSYDAVAVGYEASQKAHNALRWLLVKKSVYRCDSQAITAWAVDKQCDVIPFYEDSMGIFNDISENASDSDKLSAVGNQITDYSDLLKKAIYGYDVTDRLKQYTRRIAVLAVDAASQGRLSLVYYNDFNMNLTGLLY